MIKSEHPKSTDYNVESATGDLPLENEVTYNIKLILEQIIETFKAKSASVRFNEAEIIAFPADTSLESATNACRIDKPFTVRVSKEPANDDNINPVNISNNEYGGKITTPVNIKNKLVGELDVEDITYMIDRTSRSHTLSIFADQISHIIKRNQIKVHCIHQLDNHCYWVGKSLSLRSLETELEKVAHSRLPVVLKGEIGTGKSIAAHAIHFQCTQGQSLLIEADCASWQEDTIIKRMDDLIHTCGDGTLLLRGVSSLKEEGFNTMKPYFMLNPQVIQRLKNLFPKIIIALTPSTNPNQQKIIDWLEFHCLNVSLPRLQERTLDIPDLVTFFAAKYCVNQGLTFTDESWSLLQNYHWPENVKQLERLVEKLSILSDTSLITPHKILLLFPQLKVNSSHIEKSNLLHAEHSNHCITDLNAIANEHPAITKAVNFIRLHYNENLTMADLSSAVFVSSSHLSFLLKRHYGKTFKQILIEIRIEKARQLLQNLPARQITQICNDVGFSDLSHFEKTFKKVVGISPSIYRNQFRNHLSTSKLSNKY